MCSLRDLTTEVFSMRHRTRSSRVTEWADLVGESVRDDDSNADGDDAEEPSTER
jgi:hypothetical protein